MCLHSQAAPRAAALLALLLSPLLASAQVSLPAVNERVASAEDRIEESLRERVSFSFSERPLKEVIETIASKTGLPMRIATRKLEESAISLETLVDFSLHNMTLDSLLHNFLGDLGLTLIVKDEVVIITTPEDAASQLTTRVYPVLDLAARRSPVYDSTAVVTSRTAGGKTGIADYESLVDMITTIIEPDSWDDVGGPGSIAEFDNAGVLVISQTRDVHQKIGPLLNTLRKVKGAQGLPTIAPPARVSTPLASTAGKLADKESSAAALPERRRVIAPQRSWQLPQVYEE